MDFSAIAIPPWLAFLLTYKYLFLFVATVVEGMNSIVLAGFLTSIGQLQTIFIFPLLVLAHVINGYLWYMVGYWGGSGILTKWRKSSRVSERVVSKVEEYFKRYSGRAILFAKFTFSLEIVTMILSGVLRYPLKRFFRYNLIGSTGWVSMAFIFGFLFGKSLKISFVLLQNSFIVLAFLLGAIALLYLVKVLIKRLYLRYIDLQQRLRDVAERIRDGVNEILENMEK